MDKQKFIDEIKPKLKAQEDGLADVVGYAKVERYLWQVASPIKVADKDLILYKSFTDIVYHSLKTLGFLQKDDSTWQAIAPIILVSVIETLTI